MTSGSPKETADTARVAARTLRLWVKPVWVITVLGMALGLFGGSNYKDIDPSPYSYELVPDWNKRVVITIAVLGAGLLVTTLLRTRAQSLELRAAAIEAALGPEHGG